MPHPELQELYRQIDSKGKSAIANGTYVRDPLIHSLRDRRFGVTLLIRPPQHVKMAIDSVLDGLRETEPQQYFYPPQDIHITLLSVISCTEGFDPDTFNPEPYSNLIQKSLNGFAAPQIQLQGLIASPEAVLVRGFASAELNEMRDALRQEFGKSELLTTLDVRYPIKAAHATVMRFVSGLNDPEKLIGLLEKHQRTDFGNFTAIDVEFVLNDWYQREKYVRKLHLFSLTFEP